MTIKWKEQRQNLESISWDTLKYKLKLSAGLSDRVNVAALAMNFFRWKLRPNVQQTWVTYTFYSCRQYEKVTNINF